MPIPRRKFEHNLSDEIEQDMRKLHTFLASHSDQAFSLREVAQAMDVPDLGADVKSMQAARIYLADRPQDDPTVRKWQGLEATLLQLKVLEAVQERWVTDGMYYASGTRSLADVLGDDESSR